MATDHQLVSWLRGRHPDSALTELLERYGPMVRRAALRVTGDAHAAEDVSQAVFLVLVKKSGTLEKVRSLGGLLHRLATDAARDWLKAEARRRRREEEAAKMKAAREDKRPAPLPAGFDAALNRLPAAHRAAVVTRYLRGLSGAEAAAELGVKEGALEAHLARALARLRRALSRGSPGLTVAALGASLSAEAAGAGALTSTQAASITAAAFGGAKTTVAVMAEGMVKAMMWTKIKIAAVIVFAATALGAGGGVAVNHLAAAEPGKTEKKAEKKAGRKGPLKDLPSKPGAHIAKIRAMKDNTWLHLGSPKADPKWGKARGSSWGANALVFAPDLRGAFLFGEGRHGFVKPDGHGQDDLWFYDINAHRWICLYPGVNTKNFTQSIKDKELKIDKDGRLVDKDGQPIPVHTKIHAWGFLAYDSNLKRFTSLGGGAGFGMYYVPGGKKMKAGRDLLVEQGMGKKKGIRWSPLFYDTVTGKFDIYPVTGSYPGKAYPKFLYLPNRKEYIVAGSYGVAFFDPAKRKWSNVKTKGVKLKGYDISGCYDSKRDRVYRGPLAYDIKTSTWIDLKPKGTPPSNGGTNGMFLSYDSVLDKVVGIQFAKTKQHKAGGVFVYDPETSTWSGPSPLPKAIGNTCLNVAYDPELNVYFCHAAGDSRVGSMWVYRYKGRKK